MTLVSLDVEALQGIRGLPINGIRGQITLFIDDLSSDAPLAAKKHQALQLLREALADASFRDVHTTSLEAAESNLDRLVPIDYEKRKQRLELKNRIKKKESVAPELDPRTLRSAHRFLEALHKCSNRGQMIDFKGICEKAALSYPTMRRLSDPEEPVHQFLQPFMRTTRVAGVDGVDLTEAGRQYLSRLRAGLVA